MRIALGIAPALAFAWGTPQPVPSRRALRTDGLLLAVLRSRGSRSPQASRIACCASPPPFAGRARRHADSGAVLISRSGLDLSRFRIRYSHAAIAWKAEGGRDGGTWSARQLYYACDENRTRASTTRAWPVSSWASMTPRSATSPSLAQPPEAAQALRGAALDTPRAVHLLAARYSANAYPFSLRYQNCNQWVMELLAVAWGGLPDGDGLRRRAQQWLRDAPYKPAAVDVGSHALVFASSFVPLLHLDDHPQEDIYALKLRVSLPSAVEAFVRERHPLSERVELCHDGRQIVLHRGWEPVSDGCLPGAGDRVVALD
jgi:hypothetical protein